MKLKLKLTQLNSDSKDRKYFEQINDEAFPLSKRMSFDEIFDFASATDTDVLGIYDNQNPAGFALLLKNAECGYIYFIAIDNHKRSKGYGGAAIQRIVSRSTIRELSMKLEWEWYENYLYAARMNLLILGYECKK